MRRSLVGVKLSTFIAAVIFATLGYAPPGAATEFCEESGSRIGAINGPRVCRSSLIPKCTKARRAVKCTVICKFVGTDAPADYRIKFEIPKCPEPEPPVVAPKEGEGTPE